MQIDNKKMIVVTSVILGTILTLSVSYYLVNLSNQPNFSSQQDQGNVGSYVDPISDCQGKKDTITNLWSSWSLRWSTATTDPAGQLRAEGRAIAEEIATLSNLCSSYWDDESRVNIAKIGEVIIASIDRNIDYGPPCDPQCESGPPIS